MRQAEIKSIMPAWCRHEYLSSTTRRMSARMHLVFNLGVCSQTEEERERSKPQDIFEAFHSTKYSMQIYSSLEVVFHIWKKSKEMASWRSSERRVSLLPNDSPAYCTFAVQKEGTRLLRNMLALQYYHARFILVYSHTGKGWSHSTITSECRCSILRVRVNLQSR